MDLETYIEKMREHLSVVKETQNLSFEKLSPRVGVNFLTLGRFLARHPVGEETLVRIDKFLKSAGKFES